MSTISGILPELRLPKRYEILEREATQRGLRPQDFVVKVDSAAERVQTLLRLVRDGGTGQFEVFFGASGCGKTTFVKTLPKFFSGVQVLDIDPEIPVSKLGEYIGTVLESVDRSLGLPVVLLQDRENATEGRAELIAFFESLRRLFRKPHGGALIIWPATLVETRNSLAAIAEEVGADSVVSPDTRGVYNFQGLSRELYYEVAAKTVEGLTGDSLEAFGIPRNVSSEILRRVEGELWIGKYYSLIELESASIRQHTWDLLKEKVRPRVWIVVIGDNVRTVDGTTNNLTQGRRSRFDLERMMDALDDSTANSQQYMKDWRTRRERAGFIMRSLDVRVLHITAIPAIAAVRAFGDGAFREKMGMGAAATLPSKTEVGNAIASMKSTRFYRALKGEIAGSLEPYEPTREPGDEKKREYRKIQGTASNNDKPLNRALAEAIRRTLEQDGIVRDIVAEKRNFAGGVMQPDIQIKISDSEILCIEPTWRTAGEALPPEFKEQQNSMTPGNINKYVLEKVNEYVKALGL